MSKKDEKSSIPNTFSSSDADRKGSTLRRSRLVRKWMDKPTPKLPPARPPPAFDDDPDSFFSTTSVSSSDSSFGGFSSTTSEAETPSFNASSKPRNSCFRGPKPVKTTLKLKQSISEDECSTNKSSSSSSRGAVKIYGQLKSLKEPISPGLKLAKYINALFIKESSSSSKNSKDKNKIKNPPQESCFSGSYRTLTDRNLPTNAGFSPSSPCSSTLPKRTVRFCPVSVIEGECDADMKMGRESLTKRYEELRRMTHIVGGAGPTRMMQDDDSKDDGADDHEDAGDVNVDDSSCSSSDLFELDHLSILIGN